MIDEKSALHEAFARVSAPSSHYWSFWTPDSQDAKTLHAVEIRLNVPDHDEMHINEIAGWTIAHRKVGMLFLRRHQPISKDEIETLFWDALSIAVEHDWQFHSWRHSLNLPEWPSETL